MRAWLVTAIVVRIGIAFALAFVTLVPSHAAPRYTFTRIADTLGWETGQSLVRRVGAPQLNNLGQVVFYVQFASGGIGFMVGDERAPLVPIVGSGLVSNSSRNA